MARLLISGYYGFDNAGDEAILQTMITQFKNMEHQVEISVFSNTPETTAKQHDVIGVDRNNLWSILKAIAKTDILISGGGSLLQEATGRMSNYYYLFMYLVAMIFRKKVVVFSHGVGPIYSKSGKKMISFFFNRVALVSVRDQRSKEELIDYGVNEDKIVVTADPVFSYDKLDQIDKTHILETYEAYHPEWPTIGFALKNDKNQCISDTFVEVIERLKQEPCNIVLLPFHFHQDVEVMDRILSKTSEKIIAIKERQTVDEMFELIKNMDVLVGIRLHALIFGAVCKTPIVGISYDPKVDALLSMMQVDKSCNIDQLDSDKLVGDIRDSLKQKAEKSKSLESRVSVYRQLLNDNNIEIEKLMNEW